MAFMGYGENKDLSSGAPSSLSSFQKWRMYVTTMFQKFLDDSTPWIKARWSASLFLMVLYVFRVAYFGGWFIISYGLGIYLLNLLIGFLTPQVDPELDEPSPLPTNREDMEFKPFVRRLPEFKFWYSFTRAVIIAILCTLTRALDIPVFWPILLIYFIALFVITMKKQIKHMIKYKYIPFTFGKPTYQRSSL